MNRVHKIFRSTTEENYGLLQEVANHMNAIGHNKWLEWCALLNEHTLIGNLWHVSRRIAGRKTAIHKHPQPIEKASSLTEVFAG